jgi:membrane-associated phospholipid phosphatase
LSVATSFFLTQGLKTIFSKPRPHFLAVCEPNLTDVAKYVVGGFGQDISARWTLVDASICTQTDKSLLSDSFRSFPSGHCSFSWSGLLYVSLFLCAKFAISIPYLPLVSNGAQVMPNAPNDIELLPLHNPPPTQSSSQTKSDDSAVTNQAPPPISLPIYNQSAAPPNHVLLLVLVPLGVATYISSTRYTEFWHFGFDVISGSFIGIVSAWFGFRWYHLPIRRGQGWAWGSRSFKRAFGIGVGVGGYVGPELWTSGQRNE